MIHHFILDRVIHQTKHLINKQWNTFIKKKHITGFGKVVESWRKMMRARFHSVLACKKVTVFSQEDDEIHCSKQGQEFKAQAQSLHIEILQSPWLCS
jgi:E3 ubiquitin-protein ligase BAH